MSNPQPGALAEPFPSGHRASPPYLWYRGEGAGREGRSALPEGRTDRGHGSAVVTMRARPPVPSRRQRRSVPHPRGSDPPPRPPRARSSRRSTGSTPRPSATWGAAAHTSSHRHGPPRIGHDAEVSEPSAASMTSSRETLPASAEPVATRRDRPWTPPGRHWRGSRGAAGCSCAGRPISSDTSRILR